MWLLDPEQVAALTRLQRERDLQHLGRSLGLAFPAVVERVGDRLGELIVLGVQRGQAHGLTHMLALARYLACWFALGAEFEAKPGFEWARTLLSRPGREQGATVYRLCRRTQDELTRMGRTAGGPGVVTAAGYTQALAGLDAELTNHGDLGSLLRGPSIRLGQACDIDAADLRRVDAQPVLAYRIEQGQWRRLPGTSVRQPITLTAGTNSEPDPLAAASPAPTAGLPEALHLIAAGESGVALLRLRLQAATRCDAAVHPWVSLNSPQALREWRGDAAQDLQLNLHAAPEADRPADALHPAMAVESMSADSLLAFSACGLRDSGRSLGAPGTRLSVYPGHQHLMVWRREAGAPRTWPEAGGEPAVPAARMRIERDGVALDASRWQQGLEALDRQLTTGLRRLATAWERESGVTEGRLQAEPRLLAGTAALTWGWADSPKGQAWPPCFRIAGQMDLMACQLDLRFSGHLAWQGSSSRLSLHCAAFEPLKAVWERNAADADALEALRSAQCSFRQPFVLALDVVAQPAAAVLCVAGAVGGALVGCCGLRPRPDGAGLQWFATVDIEPVSVPLHWHDPLLGQQAFMQSLLPATRLVDWSLG